MNSRWPSSYDRATHVRILAPGAAIIESDMGVQRIWSVAKLRKDNTCSRCWAKLAKGAEAWRPLTFGDDRPNRICAPCYSDIRDGNARTPGRSGPKE